MHSLHTFHKLINSEEGKVEILRKFSALNYRDPVQADEFFGENAVGLWNDEKGALPYTNRDHMGRADAYQDLLNLLKEHDAVHFARIHKGTPYCFLGWIYFDIGDYEKAIFYIDLAILEDIRMHRGDWKNAPAARLLTLEATDHDVWVHRRIVKRVRDLLDVELAEYKRLIPTSTLTDINDFVLPGLQNPHHRTMVSSLYSFMLQQDSLQKLMLMKGEESGSLEPFLIHLRKGTIILETLLKEIYSSFSGATMNSILTDPFVTKDSGLKFVDTGRVGSTLEDIVRVLMPSLTRGPHKQQDKWVTIAYRLRNVTSHGLPWSEVITADIYKELYRHVLFSIFFLIDKKY